MPGGMEKRIFAAVAALLLGAGLAGCGNPVQAGQALGEAVTAGSRGHTPQARAATASGSARSSAGAAGRVSHWKLEDLAAAEGRRLHAETHFGDTTVTADLSVQEQALLERLLLMPPGTRLEEHDLAPDHLARAHQQSEFIYGLDGRFHRVIWQMKDVRSGKIVGYRIHSQPRDMLSGKYVVAFYGPDTRLLMAQPVWY